jgi:putative transposase
MVKFHRDGDNALLVEVANKHVVSEQTIYVWRRRFGMMGADEMKRLKSLETENAWRKKIVAERDRELEVMKDIAAKKW